jgi:NADH-quinone oxidoreductase subunit J
MPRRSQPRAAVVQVAVQVVLVEDPVEDLAAPEAVRAEEAREVPALPLEGPADRVAAECRLLARARPDLEQGPQARIWSRVRRRSVGRRSERAERYGPRPRGDRMSYSWSMILFAILAFLSVGSALLVVVNRNPVRSALFLVVNFFVLAILYLTLSAQFISAVQVIVYAGAIMVLFLFVIMLLNLGAPEALRERGGIQTPIAAVLALTFLTAIAGAGAITSGLGPSAATAQSIAEGGTVETIGKALFDPKQPWLFPFEVTSFLLLVGVVGAIVLAKRRI